MLEIKFIIDKAVSSDVSVADLPALPLNFTHTIACFNKISLNLQVTPVGFIVDIILQRGRYLAQRVHFFHTIPCHIFHCVTAVIAVHTVKVFCQLVQTTEIGDKIVQLVHDFPLMEFCITREIMRKYRKRLVIFHRKSTYIRILR